MKDINDYFADIMGYHKAPFSRYDDADSLIHGEETKGEAWFDGDRLVGETWLWEPLVDVYQARAVLRKLVERGMVGKKGNVEVE